LDKRRPDDAETILKKIRSQKRCSIRIRR
jgi:hypothetical protein